jgi:hypothetical protein
MRNKINLKGLLSRRTTEQKLALFAWLSLGICDSLTDGPLSPAEAVRIFFNADNCLFVRKHLKEPNAEEIMSRGIQLRDLSEALPAKRGRDEILRELKRMRLLSLNILEQKRLAA